MALYLHVCKIGIYVIPMSSLPVWQDHKICHVHLIYVGWLPIGTSYLTNLIIPDFHRSLKTL